MTEPIDGERIAEAVSILQAWIGRCDAAAGTEAHGRPWVDGATGRVIGTVHNFDKAIQLMGPDEVAAVSTTLDALVQLRTELSESQRWFDALVSADKAQQGAADWMLNAMRNAGKIDAETYDSLAGLLRDQINAKMCLRHPEDWTPLADRHRKALADLAEARQRLAELGDRRDGDPIRRSDDDGAH